MAHPLDNPIWASLTTLHSPFAQGSGPARRFIPEVGPLAGFEGPLAPALAALAEVTHPVDSCGLFAASGPDSAPGWIVVRQLGLLQMMHSGAPVPPPKHALLELGDADGAEMVALAHLTKPGPFSTRTRELGRFVGIRDRGRLVAMTGERLRLPGYTEVSAVCTHPEHLGRGYAAAAMSEITRRILERGEIPFLHVLPDNERAIALYERLGFRKRASFTYVLLKRA